MIPQRMFESSEQPMQNLWILLVMVLVSRGFVD
jgi:hypothetical protein